MPGALRSHNHLAPEPSLGALFSAVHVEAGGQQPGRARAAARYSSSPTSGFEKRLAEELSVDWLEENFEGMVGVDRRHGCRLARACAVDNARLDQILDR